MQARVLHKEDKLVHHLQERQFCRPKEPRQDHPKLQDPGRETSRQMHQQEPQLQVQDTQPQQERKKSAGTWQ